MLDSLLTKQTIAIVDKASNWQESIKIACKALVDNKSIEERYIDAIIQSTNELGPYYVLGPHMAMPHASPDSGVNKIALSLLVIKNGVNYNSDGNDPIKLVVILAATDNNSHVEIMGKLADFFMCDEDVNAVIDADNVDQILSIIQKY